MLYKSLDINEKRREEITNFVFKVLESDKIKKVSDILKAVKESDMQLNEKIYCAYMIGYIVRGEFVGD